MQSVFLFLSLIGSGVFATPIQSQRSYLAQLTLSQSHQNTRIFNGYTSDPIPYMVSIQKKWYGTIWSQHCGATLISADRLLTASHCFDEEEDSEYRAVFGTVENMKPGQEILYAGGVGTTEGTVFHANDNAVVQLPKRVNMDNTTVFPVCLAEKDSYPTDTYSVFGWGYYNCKELSPYLRYSMGKLVERQTCEKLYRQYSVFTSLHVGEGQLCSTFAATDGKGYFDDHADSGGPLVAVVGEDGNHIQIGIVSFGSEIQNEEVQCPDPRVPSVFSKVSAYQDFIKLHAPEAQFC
ncbi:unnamed protein product [Allacma fusca]|uniref:Peptidase S1 domain-containing protein n=1 Tax=Allacma fusca TaxID=39272 RepID=A0A8J2J6Z6_9HEXA|nr:unnamed protein product [Allacma fusca]